MICVILCVQYPQNEGRGLKDPEGVKRKKRRQEEMEKKAINDRETGGGGLKVVARGVCQCPLITQQSAIQYIHLYNSTLKLNIASKC